MCSMAGVWLLLCSNSDTVAFEIANTKHRIKRMKEIWLFGERTGEEHLLHPRFCNADHRLPPFFRCEAKRDGDVSLSAGVRCVRQNAREEVVEAVALLGRAQERAVPRNGVGERVCGEHAGRERGVFVDGPEFVGSA